MDQCPASQVPSDKSPPRLLRFQFTIARLIACTLFVALAAWVWTLKLPVGLNISSLPGRDLLPYILVSLLLAAAVGSLIDGKQGARDGVYIGCGLALIAVLIVVPLLISLVELAQWVARYF